MKLLEGRKEEGEAGTQMKEKQTAPEETESTAEELERQIRNLQRRKAPVRDGVQNEAWMYGTDRMVERMVELMNGVWRGEGFPVDWREGVIWPIFKKSVKNSEEKGVLPDSQAGFRKGRGTMDKVYILDILTRNELRKKGGRMCALFVDFRAAFDKVDRVKIHSDGKVQE
jgi:hypothetical protein